MIKADLYKPKNIAEMVDVYQSAMGKVEQGYRLLEEAEKELRTAFNNDYFRTIDQYSYASGEDAIENIRKETKKRAWETFINKMGVRKFLSVKRAKEFDERLEHDELPEIELQAVMNELTGIMQSSSHLAKEAAIEVSEILRPAKTQSRYRAAYKTNLKNGRYSIGPKIILRNYVYSESYHSGRVIYDRESDLRAIDRVFHLLDGSGIPNGYRGELIDAINTSSSFGFGETKYFKFRTCKNGNLHLEFKRMDLVNKLNSLVGDGTSLEAGGA